jgi:hypothetical protein
LKVRLIEVTAVKTVAVVTEEAVGSAAFIDVTTVGELRGVKTVKTVVVDTGEAVGFAAVRGVTAVCR